VSIEHIYKKLDEEIGPNRYELYGVGISMGANLLLRYQAIHSQESRFKALISFSNPFDVQLASNLMKATFYEKYIQLGAKQAIFKAQRITD